jgi:thiol-disulfide isomerase/thioredoxin
MQRRNLLTATASGAVAGSSLIWTPQSWAQAETKAKPPMAPSNQTKAPAVGDAAPKLIGKTTDLRDFTLKAEKGRVALVAFWATWCPKCRVEMPIFRAAHEKSFSRGLDLVTVSIDRNLNDVIAYDRVVEKTVPVTQRFAQLWRGAEGHQDGFGPVLSTPTVYLINRKQRVAAIFKGRLTDDDWVRIEREIRGA